jgi:hypothetical protein
MDMGPRVSRELWLKVVLHSTYHNPKTILLSLWEVPHNNSPLETECLKTRTRIRIRTRTRMKR